MNQQKRYSPPSLNLTIKLDIWRRLKIDPLLLITVAILLFFGLLTIYSASSSGAFYVKRQLISSLVGFFALFFLARVNTSYHKNHLFGLYLILNFLILLTLFLGQKVNGSTRWLSLYFVSFQPSEFMKIILPSYVAHLICRDPLPVRWKTALLAMGVTLPPFFLVYLQPDLGTAIFLLLGTVIALFLGGLPWKIIIPSIIAFFASFPLLWFFVLQGYHRRRILNFINPESDRFGAGWQTLQSKIAIGSGGFFGKGYLESTQARLEFLPESHTDFILAVFGEEFGFLGLFVLFLIYLIFLLRGGSIALHSKNSYDRILGGTFVLIMAFYIVANTLMVLGLFPTVGVPLLLISYGGSSVLSVLMMTGVLMSIAHHPKLN